MPSGHEKDGGEPATAVPLSRRELLAVSVSGLVASPETSTLLESTPAAIPAAAAAAIFPDRWWERQGRHNPPPGTKIPGRPSIRTTGWNWNGFYFEIYCEEMCDATGDPEQDKAIDELMAAWQRIRADNEAFFAQQQVSRSCEPETGRQGR